MEDCRVRPERIREIPSGPAWVPLAWAVVCVIVLGGCLVDFDNADGGNDGGGGDSRVDDDSGTGCIDEDGDGYGAGCSLGADCDDGAPGILGPCNVDGCPEGWILVPEGPFQMGCDETDPCWEDMVAESPAQQVELDGFCVQKTEVTVAQYRACREAGICSGVPDDTQSNPFCNWTPIVDARENHPVNCISWPEAREYCEKWFGGDLPTEAQWEKAARGTDGRTFPWGDNPEPNCDLCNFDVDGTGGPNTLGCAQESQGPGTWEVPRLPEGGGSPFGVLDLAGNVYEWVQDCYHPGFYGQCGVPCYEPVNQCGAGGQRVIRGGAYSTAESTYLRAVWRGMLGEAERVPHVGLRCRHH
jgi:formylglycine-generating enzyme required for sulfatase activity